MPMFVHGTGGLADVPFDAWEEAGATAVARFPAPDGESYGFGLMPDGTFGPVDHCVGQPSVPPGATLPTGLPAGSDGQVCQPITDFSPFMPGIDVGAVIRSEAGDWAETS